MIKPFMRIPILLCMLVAVSWLGCERAYTPKPRAFPRVQYPERGTWQRFDNVECPFAFSTPDYYRIERRSAYFDSLPEHPCWGTDLNIDALNGTIYLTYKELQPGQTLGKLTEDAYRLTFKHAQKADYIEPHEIRTPNGAFGLLYDVGGNAASPLQFFVTDTLNHFLRGSLNFRSRPNADSLAPVVAFVREDVLAIISTLEWK